MNHPIRRVLYCGIVLLLLALAFAAIANASSENESARLAEPQVSMLQPPQPVTYTLTVNVNPGGSGTWTKNPNLPVYISGTAVILTANPATGYKFDNWTGDLNATANPATITVIKNSVVTANFSLLSCWTLTIARNPVAGGSVSPSIAPNCTGGTQYITDTTVVLTPSANAGYVFSGWTGCDSTSGTTCTMKMNAAKTVTAAFSSVTCYTLTTAVNPSGVGTVTVNTPPNCGTQYTSGTTVSLTAIANSGYTFSSWTGCTPSAGTSCTVAMSTNRVVIANFAAIPVVVPTSTATPEPTSTSSPLATITPLTGGVVVATATVAPTPSASSLPSTGASPLIWIAMGLVLVLVAIGARYMRQSAS